MALYGNGFPVTYPQMFPQYQQPYQQIQNVQQLPNVQQQQVQQSNIIWVEGEADARSFQLAPNSTIPLWDRNAQVIYYKSSDASGMPSLKILDYTIRDKMQENGTISQSINGNGNYHGYVTKAEFDVMVAEIASLKAQIESLSVKRNTKQTKKEESDDE